MKKAIYVCIEGTEGVGKTTQVDLISSKLKNLGYKVLKTKEPGTSHIPVTMRLREIMLSNEFDSQLTVSSRELISQAIRSIHIEKLVASSIYEYDFIIQDRGMLSGYAYGVACGNKIEDLKRFTKFLTSRSTSAANSAFNLKVEYTPESIYDKVILLKGNIEKSLNKAISSKKEFASGDAIESRGVDFIESVSQLMNDYMSFFDTQVISIDNKSIEEINAQIMQVLLEKYNEKQ